MHTNVVIADFLLFFLQTFTVGTKLLALYTLASAEDSVFVVIPKKGERGTVQVASSMSSQSFCVCAAVPAVSCVLQEWALIC